MAPYSITDYWIRPQSIRRFATRMRLNRWRVLLTGLIVTTFLFPAHAALARQACFADRTPYCLTEPFIDYWEQNGGLPVFGYPIAPAANEVNGDTGRSYLTQWVERNRLEDHPEESGPYRVLLGLLGKERLAQLGRDWRAEPREAGPQAGCLWFEQTGHNVCNQTDTLGFKTYWETHGLGSPGLDRYTRSLQLFGLPLTAPKMETNSSGDTVLTQWFERARFEWHPDNPNDYKVLLGLLGKEVRQHQDPFAGQIIFARMLSAENADLFTMRADGSEVKALTNTPEYESAPAVSPDGQSIVFTVSNGVPGGGSIYRMNRDGTNRIRLTDGVLKFDNAIWAPDGKTLLVSAYQHSNWDLYRMSTDGATMVNLTNTASDEREGHWSHRGTNIVFTSTRDDPNGKLTELYTLDVTTGVTTRLTTNQFMEGHPRWSPDGAHIAVAQWDETRARFSVDLVIMKADGTHAAVIWGQIDGGGAMPTWSPDGRYLAFVQPSRTGPSQLWTIRADGQEATQRTMNTRDGSGWPVWVSR